jgi:hypothetical protein
MRATMSWAAPAVLLACAMGCGHEGTTTKKATSPSSTPSKTEEAPVSASMTMVTLKVDGMT